MLEEIKKNIEDMKVKSDAYLEGYSDAVHDVEELLEKRAAGRKGKPGVHYVIAVGGIDHAK